MGKVTAIYSNIIIAFAFSYAKLTLKLERKEWQQTGASRRLQNTGRNPTDRGKRGIKRHILVDRRGAQL